MKRYASVILEVSIQTALDYLIPDALIEKVAKGVYVEVPLRTTAARGYVVEVKESSNFANCRPISKVVSDGAIVTDELFQLALWMAKYYVCPLGKVLKTMLPAGVRKNVQLKTQALIVRKKGPKELREHAIELRSKAPQQAAILDALLMSPKDGIFLSELVEQTSAKSSSIRALQDKGFIHIEQVRDGQHEFEEYFKSKPKALRDEQKEALGKVVSSMAKRAFDTHLLFGITGSGKTEVYLQAIDKALELGLGVIMLVPEISLTQQTIQHFKSRFDVPLAVLHHRLSDGERWHAWQSMQQGKSRICIGARSAIFCPMPNLGLIIIDEEHELSYKQTDDAPSYSARDVAVMRGKLSNCPVLLGSATPSLESYHNALSGKYQLSVLRERPANARLPAVHIVDMKREFAKAKGYTSFSELLLEKIEERKERGEHTILFLNRRGYHTILSCMTCGKSIKCPHCDATLTFHLGDKSAACHLCGFVTPPPKSCPSCKAADVIKYQGVGTEKIQAMLHGIFPGIRTIRVDADSTRHKGSLEKLLTEFRSGKADVLIGTQMVAKGLHFPQVTLVGVINADASLNIPDFRAQETVFQLITQVAGRAGRGQLPGEVVIQTAVSEHSTIQQAAKQDYEAFYSDEIAVRKTFSFPPFCRLVKFQFSGKEEAKVRDHAEAFRSKLAEHLPATYCSHPLVPSGHAKVKDLFRFQFFIRGPHVAAIMQALQEVDALHPLPSSINRYIDVDPSSTFF